MKLVWSLVTVTLFASLVCGQEARGRSRIDVINYRIQADVDPRTQTLKATARIRFQPVDDRITTIALDLHNSLNVTSVMDGQGRALTPTRNLQEYQLHIAFPDILSKGTEQEVVVSYEGRLSGQEESPVYGVKFAAIKPDYGFLLYPARWFPVNEYTADRYTAELAVTVPEGFTVVTGGIETSGPAPAGKKTTVCNFAKPSLAGSLGIVREAPKTVSSGGVTALTYFRGEAAGAAQSWGEETGKVLGFLTGMYGLAPYSAIGLIETEEGAPNGYAAPGLLFLNPRAIGSQANPRLLVNQLARQWWGLQASPATRNHLWITNGMARYAELLWVEQSQGPGALEGEVRDTYVEAMTVDNPPLIQASRFEDYSPEYWATTAGKGAAVYHMLRSVIGEEKFKELLKTVPDRFAGRGITTENLKDVASQLAGQDLGYFFIQWIESSGAPEFKLEYTVYRTKKGFRIMGKISQDLDTFRMPVSLKIETEGNPEEKVIDVSGTSSEFLIETFGKPKRVDIDVNNKLLRMSRTMRVAVSIRKGEMFAEIGEYGEALKEYTKALDVARNSSLAHYRVGEVFFLQNNYQSAANVFRESLNGDLEPKWTEVWGHINLGKIFDITGQRERAVNEYNLAIRTKDNTQNAQEEAAKYLKEPFKRAKPAF
ncbi:MAG: M1 family aminopeptidase [Acidobacteria bacterium]|nr:M1 family aminopeptidase [Acidobacteriota bacterium]